MVVFFKYCTARITCICFNFSIYVVHDEVKDKNFELELSWVGERK